MKTFDYVTILFSIMLGVCITQMATNVVLVIQNYSNSILSAPAILWNAAALLAILAHWVHFHKASNRESWSGVDLTIVFVTPLIYFIPATLLEKAPLVNGQLDYQVLFEANKTLVYISVLLFLGFTMAQYYRVYGDRRVFKYVYYSIAGIIVIIALIINSPTLDLVLSWGIFISEFLHHYVIDPIRLPMRSRTEP